MLKCHRTTEPTDGKVGNATLVFRRMSYNRENNTFMKAAEGAVVLGGGISSRAAILTCRCVINCQKRVKTPCVLVLKKSERKERFQYSLFTLCSDRLELCLQFRLPYEILRENVRVLRGPAVTWRHAGDVFLMSLRTGAVKTLPVQVPRALVGELPLSKGNEFYIGVQELSNTRSVSPNLGYFIESGQTFDGSMILPHPYISITQCMLVLSAENTDCGRVLQSAVVAATSQRQLVYFENGMVKNACRLPFEHPNNIQMVDTGRSGSMFAVTFQQGHACAVWKETFQVWKKYFNKLIPLIPKLCPHSPPKCLSSHLQIAAHWSNVDSVHAGDFLGCGTDQILIVFKDPGVTGQPLEKFLLTDLSGITYTVRIYFV